MSWWIFRRWSILLLVIAGFYGCHAAPADSDPPAPPPPAQRFAQNDSVVVILHVGSAQSGNTARVTARIADIRPDGTLVLDGRRHFPQPNGSIDLALTGSVHPGDVTPEGTVEDNQVIDLHFTTSHAEH